jgi:hypothetical protein
LIGGLKQEALLLESEYRISVTKSTIGEERERMDKETDFVKREQAERRYEDELERLQKEAQAEVEAIRESRRLTDRDLQIMINTRT